MRGMRDTVSAKVRCDPDSPGWRNRILSWQKFYTCFDWRLKRGDVVFVQPLREECASSSIPCSPLSIPSWLRSLLLSVVLDKPAMDCAGSYEYYYGMKSTLPWTNLPGVTTMTAKIHSSARRRRKFFETDGFRHANPFAAPHSRLLIACPREES